MQGDPNSPTKHKDNSQENSSFSHSSEGRAEIDETEVIQRALTEDSIEGVGFQIEEENRVICSASSSGNSQFSALFSAPLKELQLQPRMVLPSEKQKSGSSRKQQPEKLSAVEVESILKLAEMQRIGGTKEFFEKYLIYYQYHLSCRKLTIQSVEDYVELQKKKTRELQKCLRKYFEDYSNIVEQFHEKTYKYALKPTKSTPNRTLNLGEEFKEGLDKLLSMRKYIGNCGSRIMKFIAVTVLPGIEKVFSVYMGTVESQQRKIGDLRQGQQQAEKRLMSKIDKMKKIYFSGMYGINEADLFVETSQFIEEDINLKGALLAWSKASLTLRKVFLEAEYTLMLEVGKIIKNFQNQKDIQFSNKKLKFEERIRDEIMRGHSLAKHVSPTDTDYIKVVLELVMKSDTTLLSQQQYEQFFEMDYFEQIIGSTKEFLKSAVIKSFALNKPNEELIKTISGNLVYYNRKTKEVKAKFVLANTKAEPKGKGVVELQETIKGIIFDSDNAAKICFSDELKAEEFMLYLEMYRPE